MRMKYFGDSYDVVKQRLLEWLPPIDSWTVHPMFTEPVTEQDAAAFSAFLGAPLLSTAPLTRDTNRHTYFECTDRCGNLFLDPNTGIQFDRGKSKSDPDYIYSSELKRFANDRPTSLTLVFDKSVPRGTEFRAVAAKLHGFREMGIFGFGYVSHACFLVLGKHHETVEQAYNAILSRSRLPKTRFVHGSPPNTALLSTAARLPASGRG